ncbi:hypothetical protein HYU07_01600 [Candidatus Woesearchaeota archaeon]|nr:hypothetical protein [Candidatus Woesearchaeota archaeon]
MDITKERIKNLEMILTPVKEKKGAILQTVWGLGKVACELYLEIEGIYIPILNKYLQISGYIDMFNGSVRLAKCDQPAKFKSAETWIYKMLKLPTIKSLFEKGDDISIDKITQIHDLCRRLDVKVENGRSKKSYPPYLMLKLEKTHIGMAYGKRFEFREYITDEFIERNSAVIKEIYNALFKMYNEKIEGFDKWKKQLNI